MIDRTRRMLRRLPLSIIAIIVVPPLLIVGAFQYAGDHRVLPGVRGCRLVRSFDAKVDCLAGVFDGMVSEIGARRAVRKIDRELGGEQGLQSACHLAWHGLGERRGEESRRRGAAPARVTGGSFCTSGYDHGYLIGYFARSSEREILRMVDRTCHGGPLDEVLNCVHSFGHAFARQNPDNRVDGTTRCEQIDIPGTWDRPVGVADYARFECEYGAFMEYASPAAGTRHAAPRCARAMPARVSAACYAFLPVGLLRVGRNPAFIARRCEAAPSDVSRGLCVAALVRDVGDGACDAVTSPSHRSQCRRIARGAINADEILARLDERRRT